MERGMKGFLEIPEDRKEEQERDKMPEHLGESSQNPNSCSKSLIQNESAALIQKHCTTKVKQL